MISQLSGLRSAIPHNVRSFHLQASHQLAPSQPKGKNPASGQTPMSKDIEELCSQALLFSFLFLRCFLLLELLLNSAIYPSQTGLGV
jgi:hypothetical protein